jgi:ABC-type cobalamin/Fe3+-siderophores transport system ATPase subunit
VFCYDSCSVSFCLNLRAYLVFLYAGCRLVEPTSGELLIDGVNVLNISLHGLRNNIAIVPQVTCRPVPTPCVLCVLCNATTTQYASSLYHMYVVLIQ